MVSSEGSAAVSEKEIRECHECFQRLRRELSKVVVGQKGFVEQVLITLLAGGHALIDGVPGMAKTVLVRSLAEMAGLPWRRLEFTPDLAPADVFDLSTRAAPAEAAGDHSGGPAGPLGGNFILVDQIDRGPRKTQSVLLEAIDQGMVVVGGRRWELPKPVFLVATRNPLDREGTHPLGQAALDRFLVHFRLEYPPDEDEWELARRGIAAHQSHVERLTTGEAIWRFQQLIGRLPVTDPVLRYASSLVRATRPQSEEAPEFVDRWVAWGAGPRAVVGLVACAKARAVLRGRSEPGFADVQAMAPAVLRHRIAPNEVAQADALTADRLIDMLLEAVRPEGAPEEGLDGFAL